MTDPKYKPLSRDFNRQNRLGIYGDGPMSDDMDHPCDNQDVAIMHLHREFTVVRVEWLDALEALVKTQATYIAKVNAAMYDVLQEAKDD